METKKYGKPVKRLTYICVFLFMVAFHYLTDDRPAGNPDKWVHSYSKAKKTEQLAQNYYMPDNEICRTLISELKTNSRDFQVNHLFD